MGLKAFHGILDVAWHNQVERVKDLPKTLTNRKIVAELFLQMRAKLRRRGFTRGWEEAAMKLFGLHTPHRHQPRLDQRFRDEFNHFYTYGLWTEFPGYFASSSMVGTGYTIEDSNAANAEMSVGGAGQQGGQVFSAGATRGG